MKAVFLDYDTVSTGDLDTSALRSAVDDLLLCDTDDAATPERIRGVEIVMTNKVELTRELLAGAPRLRLIAAAGTGIEQYVGPRRLLACYFASVVTAALTQLFVPALFGASPGPTIGASGGVFGLILAYAVMFPKRKVAVYFLIPMPVWLFATLYAGIELYLGVTGTAAGVAHFAHLGGMVGSALVIMQWRRPAAYR